MLQTSKNKLIGGGSFGRVYYGIYRGTPVAVKTLSIYFESPTDKALLDFEQEAKILL